MMLMKLHSGYIMSEPSGRSTQKLGHFLFDNPLSHCTLDVYLDESVGSDP